MSESPPDASQAVAWSVPSSTRFSQFPSLLETDLMYDCSKSLDEEDAVAICDLHMGDRKKALHDLIEQVSEQDLPLLAELIARFQHPLDFPLQPVSAAPAEPGPAQRQQELIREAHRNARSTHLRRQHTDKVAKRLGIEPERIEFSSGGGSIGVNDAVEMVRHWTEGSAFCRLNTFQVDQQDIITFDQTAISSSRLEVAYKLRVLTARAESETDLYVPV